MAEMTFKQIWDEVNTLTKMSNLNQIKFAEENGLADSLVQYFLKERNVLKANQLRKVFSAIKLIQRKIEVEIGKNEKVKEETFEREAIAPLLVNLAYARGRGLLPKEFYEILTLCLSKQKLRTNEDFMRVAQFTEAILAYYKFRGGTS